MASAADQREVLHWMGRVVGEDVDPDGEGLAGALHDGTVLIRLLNTLRPGTITKYKRSPRLPFQQMENISQFLVRARSTFKLREFDMFVTNDLYKAQDILRVVNCLRALRRVVGDPGGGLAEEKGGGARGKLASLDPYEEVFYVDPRSEDTCECTLRDLCAMYADGELGIKTQVSMGDDWSTMGKIVGSRAAARSQLERWDDDSGSNPGAEADADADAGRRRSRASNRSSLGAGGWYYLDTEAVPPEPIGPLSGQQIIDWLDLGKLRWNTEVSNDGKATWRILRNVGRDELAGGGAEAAAAEGDAARGSGGVESESESESDGDGTDDEWYLVNHQTDEVQGPYPKQDIMRMSHNRILTNGDMLSNGGEWVPAGTLPWFLEAAGTPSAPSPPGPAHAPGTAPRSSPSPSSSAESKSKLPKMPSISLFKSLRSSRREEPAEPYLMCGWLHKFSRGRSRKGFLSRLNWKKRYFGMSDSELVYYKSTSDCKKRRRALGRIPLEHTDLLSSKKVNGKYPFTLCHGSTQLLRMYAETKQDRIAWMKGFRELRGGKVGLP